MLTARIIPCLDVKDGRVVKGIISSSARAGDPVEVARRYERKVPTNRFLDISAVTKAGKSCSTWSAASRKDFHAGSRWAAASARSTTPRG